MTELDTDERPLDRRSPPRFGRRAAVVAGPFVVLGLRLATPLAAEPLLTRDALDLQLASDSVAWACTIDVTVEGFGISSRPFGSAEILLQEVDAVTGAVGTPIVIGAGDFDVILPESCSVLPLPALGKVIVAYTIVAEDEPINLQRPHVAFYDETLETVTTVVISTPSKTVTEPPDIEIRRLGDRFFLNYYGRNGTGTQTTYWVKSFEDLDALLADDGAFLDLGPEDFELLGWLSGDLVADADAGVVRQRYLRETFCPKYGSLGGFSDRGHRTAEWDSTGALVSSSFYADPLVTGNEDVFACLGQKAFATSYYNVATGSPTHLALVPSLALAGYRLFLVETNFSEPRPLHDLTPGAYYGLAPSMAVERPEGYGFSPTLDVLLSSDDQWVLGSRDPQTGRLALHRVPAAFPDDASKPMLEPGTQRPGPLFCGAELTAGTDSIGIPNSYLQNNSVDVEETPSGGSLLVAYYQCPGGDEGDAELVVDVVPLDFPVLLDDRDYATTRGQTLALAAPGVLANDSGLDGPTLGVFEAPANGQVALDADGSFVYVPDPNFCGADEFTYSVLQDSETYLARAVIDVECPTAAAWWTFDELETGSSLVASDRVLDIAGSSRDAYAVENQAGGGPGVVAGSPSTLGSPALSLNSGDSDRLTFEGGYTGFNDAGSAAGPTLDFGAASSFTLEAVIRLPENSADDSDVIVGKVSSEGNSRSWFLQVSSAGYLQGKIHDGVAFTTVNGSLLIDDDAWHRVAFVRDTGADELRLYVDGVLDGTETDTTTATLSNALPLAIGSFASGSRQFGGLIDEVRITAAALAPEDFLYSGARLPHAAPDTAESPKGAPLLVEVTANDDFGLDGPLPGTIAIVSAENTGAVVDDGGSPDDPTDDSIEVSPEAAFAGQAVVVYRITDLNGDVSEATLTVQVRLFADAFESGDFGAWARVVQ